MKILFLAKSPDATKHYRCDIPAKYLIKSGHEVRVGFLEPIPNMSGTGIQESDVEWSDVIVVQRPASEYAIKCVRHIKERRPDKIIVGEYDDDYQAVPRWNPGYVFIKANEKAWRSIIGLFDGVIASTAPLSESLARLTNAPRVVIRNGFDLDEFESLEKLPVDVTIVSPDPSDTKRLKALYTVTHNQFNELMKDKMVVTWAGSRFHYVDLDWITEEMKELAKKADDVVFLFVGYFQGNLTKSFPVNRLFVTGGQSPVCNFYRLLKSLKIDVMVAPLDPCEFNRSKSALKLYEACALGTIPVCSEWDAYEEDMFGEYGEGDLCGRLVGYNKGDWVRALMEIRDIWLSGGTEMEDARRMNQEYVRRNHDASLRSAEYISFFEQLMRSR